MVLETTKRETRHNFRTPGHFGLIRYDKANQSTKDWACRGRKPVEQ